MNPWAEAFERLGGAYEVRVLEPSPPAVADEPFADDPVARGDVADGRPLVRPVNDGDLTWDELAAGDPGLRDWCADRWLGAWRPVPPVEDPASLAATRVAWHALAEHVLTPARHAANGKIGLRFTRGGFGTPFFGDDEQLRVESSTVVHVRGGAEVTRAPITTIEAAATMAGRELGTGTGVYQPTTALEPGEALDVDATSARVIAAWFGFGASVLEQLRADGTSDDDPSLVQLWPEHFDLALEVGNASRGARGTFGASPGDDAHPEPYLYVTHWADVPPDPFWNDAAFAGASLALGDLPRGDGQRDAALAFFCRARELLGAA